EIYEDLPGCPKPPLVPFPAFDYLVSSEHSGIQYKQVPRWLVKAWWTMTGFRSFYRRLPQQIERLLREREIHGPLNGLVNAATVALKDDPSNVTPADRATSLIFALYDLYEDVRSGNFEPDRYQGEVLEMGHYLNLFSTSFIVEEGKPRLFKSTNASDLTVIIEGKYFSLRVGPPNPETSFKQLKQALADVIEEARKSPPNLSASPGPVTCAEGPTQLEIFSRLAEDPVNVESLMALRHSLATVCLDLDTFPASAAEAALIAQSGNCGNRWFHSSLQLVVFGNGLACLILHPGANLPGDTSIRAADEIQFRALKYRDDANEIPEPGPSLPPARELKWNIERDLLIRARADLEKVIDTQQSSFEIRGIGKTFFASHQISGVPVFIIALQMAIKRLTGRIDIIAQFLTMTKYRCMSFVTAAVTTKEVIDFVNYLDGRDFRQSDGPELERAFASLQRAVDSQIQECRRVRRYLPFQVAYDLFLMSNRKSKSRFQRLRGVIAGRIIGLAHRAGLIELTRMNRHVLASHPRTYSNLSILGRPGIRLPYIADFGIHYQLHDDKIITTIMPSLTWSFPNTALIAALEESLAQIQTLIKRRVEIAQRNLTRSA
ncbi:MAG TPA: choline/carnitine O-acyltransferase, partial [Blastocatellia bacterium]|nr:choline/carnitine O-acyltransferase [Blastocatellia bacterium]